MKKTIIIFVMIASVLGICINAYASNLIMMEEPVEESKTITTVAEYIASYDLASLAKEWAETIAELEASGAEQSSGISHSFRRLTGFRS